MAAVMSSEKKTVLVAVDHSSCSDNALEYYLTFLHQADHKVVLVHAAEVPKLATPVHGVNIHEAEVTDSLWREAHELRESELKLLHTHLEEVMAGVDNSIDHEILITQYHHGHLGEAIVDMAIARDATLIVIGSRGMGTLRRTILGSVSDYVLHHAKCPVMVCHFDSDKYHHLHVPQKSH